jgi:hypothetical protein
MRDFASMTAVKAFAGGLSWPLLRARVTGQVEVD